MSRIPPSWPWCAYSRNSISRRKVCPKRTGRSFAARSLHDESLIVSRLGVEGTTPYLQIQKQYVEELTAERIEDSGSRERIAAVHHPKGEPGIVIPALALEIGADVVILGSAARRGLQGFFMGSVAETILSRLTCSALVVKRPGFLSPVKVG